MVYPTFLSAICLPHNQPWTYLRGYSVIHAMLISAFNLYLTQKVTRSLLASLGPRALLLLLLLLLLFVFNIYVLVVVISVISSVRRVITKWTSLTDTLVFTFQIFFSVFLQFPTRHSFALTLHVIPNFPINLSNAAETLPRALITTGTISTYLNSHNLLISFSKCWYFSTFSFSFPLLLHQLVQQYQ